MFVAILNALAALPALFSYIEKFSLWLSDQIVLINKRRALEDAQKAIDKAKATKDTSDLDGLFGGKK